MSRSVGSMGKLSLIMRKMGCAFVLLALAPAAFALPAIDLTGNTGAIIRFDGGVTVDATNNTGFNATGGGTVHVTGAANTIRTTTATALNVANTTIGASDLTFRSINSNGGANPGIMLSNTGSSGGLTVSGIGGGGTIQNKTGKGITLNQTSDVSLTNMTITACGDDGIDGTSVNGFVLSTCNVTNNGNAPNEEGLNFVNLNGVVSISGCTVTGSAYNNLRVENTSGNMSSLNITGSSFSNNSPVDGNHGILLSFAGSSVLSSGNISTCTLSGNRSMGVQVVALDTANIADILISENTITNNQLAIDCSKSQTSNMTFRILNNLNITGQNSHGINTFSAAGNDTGGTFTGTISGNHIGNSAVDGSGSRIGNGIRVNLNGQSDNTILIENNIVRECPVGRGIEIISRNGTGGSDVTVVGNDVDHVNLTFDTLNGSDFPLAAIFLQSNCVTVCNTLRCDVRNNTVPAGTAFDLLSTFITLVETGASTHQLLDTGSVSANPSAQLTENNTGSASANAGVSLITGSIDIP